MDQYRRFHAGGERLSGPQSDALAKMYRDDEDAYRDLLTQVNNDFRELRLILGWTFDAKILSHLSRAIRAVNELIEVPQDNAERVAALLVESYIFSWEVGVRLARRATS